MTSKNILNYLLASTILSGAFIGQTALAQQATTTASTDATIVVTGSRIKNKEFSNSAPVTIITQEKSVSAGLVTAAEILQSSSVANGSGQINNTFTGFVVDGGGGINTISLRGLGAQRSLVLLNGRRMPPAGVGGSVAAVDLNAIPNDAVVRYEILKDGASSVYGSDAVAGVVNIITRSNFEGFEVTGTVRATQEGGGDNYNLSAMWGKSFDRGHLMVSLSGNESGALRKGDRKGLDCQQDYITNADGSRADLVDPLTGDYKCWGWTTGGIVINDTYFRVPRTGSSAFGVPGWFGPVQFVNREMNPEITDRITIMSPVKRYTAFVQGEYRPEFMGGGELYTELLWNNRQSEQNGLRYLFPYYDPQSPQNPFGGLGAYVYPYFLTASDDSQDVSVARGVFGARGEFKKWNWDVYATFSQSNGDYEDDVIIKDRVFYGTGLNEDTFDFIGVCPPAAPAGCVPLNLLTPAALNNGTLTDAERNYFFAKDHGNTKYDQTILEGTLTGDLMQLPAGPLGAAFGLSYRHDEINDVPGEYSRTGNSWGSASAGITKGDDSLVEAFAEFQIPLIAGKPFFEDLKLNLSGRYSDYDSVGDAFTYKVGMNWALNNVVRLRGTYGTSFRAPGLYEMFLNAQTGFLAQRSVDPCLNYNVLGDDGQPVKNATVRANCAAAGIPGDYSGANYGGSGSSALVEWSGNPNLDPEESEAWTLGFAFTPPGTGFKFAVDFWGIEVSQQISSTGAGVVGACYNQTTFPNNGFCSLFQRNAGYNIVYIDASYRNIPSEKTEGIDFTVAYEHDFSFGKISSDLDLTYTSKSVTQLFPGDEEIDYNGTVADPELVGDLQTSWTKGSWRVTHTLNYVGPSSNLGFKDEDGQISYSYAPLAYNKTRTETFITHDISVRYQGNDWQAYVGVINFTDESAPSLGGGDDAYSAGRLGNYAWGSQYGSGYLGRSYYVQVKKSF